jgi:hypothetical protein
MAGVGSFGNYGKALYARPMTPLKYLAMWLAMIGAFAAEPITIKVRHTHNRVILPGSINDLPVSILLDSACTIPTLHPTVMDRLNVEASGTQRIVGIAGEERAPTYRGLVFDFGEAKYAPRRVASIPSERSESRRRRDGVIGSSFFHQYVVEFDHRASLIRLHSPTNFSYAGNGEVVKFRFREEIPVVEGAIILPGREEIAGEFEVDSGCDSGLCLGEKFVREQKLLERIESRSGEKFGIGGSVETKMGAVPGFRLGKLVIEKPQTDFFQSGSPVDEPMVGHIGMGVFHRYRVILNYSRRELILESY